MLLSVATGSVQQNINITQVHKLQVPLPPLRTQKAIAHILGTLDDKIELLRQMNETLEAMARALFKSWFIDFDPVRNKAEGKPTGLPPEIDKLFPNSFVDSELGEIPKGWDVRELGDVIEINPLRSLSKGKITTYLEMKNLPEQGMSPTNWEKKEYAGGAKFKNGDTLLARITPCLENGKTSYIQFLEDDEIAFGSTEYFVLSSSGNFPPEWCYLLARDETFRDYAISHMNGSSGRQRVERDSISRYRVPLPSDERIFIPFQNFIRPCFQENHAHSLEMITLQQMRDSMLPKLISGELELTDKAINKILELTK
jgi:type I restriction enzyme S subunit